MKYGLILLVFVCYSCHPKYENINKKEALWKLNKMAKQEYGDVYKIEENENGRYAIVSKLNKDLGDLFPSIHYFIFDHRAQIVIRKDYLKAGSIKWISRYEIQAISRDLNREEAKRGQNKIKYIFNVKLKEIKYQ